MTHFIFRKLEDLIIHKCPVLKSSIFNTQKSPKFYIYVAFFQITPYWLLLVKLMFPTVRGTLFIPFQKQEMNLR